MKNETSAYAIAFFAVALTFVPSGAHAVSASLEREGSVLQIHIDADADGSYILSDGSGNPCSSGRFATGQSTIRLDKVASPTDLKLEVTVGGSIRQTVDYPGIRKISPFAKPDHAAVIYQLPVRSYMARGAGRSDSGRLAELTTERLSEIKDLGVDYLWVTGVLEYASLSQTDPDVVKGEAGSYYAIYDNWDVSNELGGLTEFEGLIARAHGVGLRVMIDFVANHTARLHRTDVTCKQHLDFGLHDRTDVFFDPRNNYFNIRGNSFTPPAQPGSGSADGVFDTDIFTPGIQLETPARVTGNDIISSQPQIYDWFETAKLNYGYDIATRAKQYEPRPRTWDQMLDVATYWVEKGVDGFRFDFAHSVPIEFWRFLAENLRTVNPEVFLMAEAYESDARMRIPGFSYYALLDAGIDTVYNSEIYWAIHNIVNNPGRIREANPYRMPAMRREIVDRGFMFTQYMENHDEVRLASRHFARWVGERSERAELGLAFTAYTGLMPGHVMLHGGQELQEDASIFGSYAGDNGRTSIFDYVYQAQTRTWIYRDRPAWMTSFRERYKKLLSIKRTPPFSNPHSLTYPTFVDLDPGNHWKDQSKWIASYIRYDGTDAYLVVLNSDPFTPHEATLHFTTEHNRDTFGALRALGIANDETRYRFVEVFSRPGFEARDPNVQGRGIPGWALFRSGDVPSGLYLGEVPPRTTYVFKLVRD